MREAGRLDEAQRHRDLAYRKQCLFVTNSPTAVRTVLMLIDAGKGNVPFQFLFPARENNLIEWMIEYATEDQYRNLPPFDVVFNAIGDPDVSDTVTRAQARFMGICDKPLLNSPAAVARTARYRMPELFSGVAGLLIPAVWRVEQNGEWFANPDFQFPVLVRPPASQGGEGLTLVESRAALASMAPDRTGVIHLCNYHDYRSADGCFRKYRIIFVDRRPYPYHLAISGQWMVHYHTANMLLPWKLEEERRFLEDPAAVLGAAGMAAIEAMGKRLDLDYAGVDFSILPDGRLLIFEANATMLAHPEQDDALKFKNPYIQKIFDAFGELLAQSCGKGRTGAANPQACAGILKPIPKKDCPT
jgi:glutathione synthase/RimK-type ligase-like ATP-grasp enzyme